MVRYDLLEVLEVSRFAIWDLFVHQTGISSTQSWHVKSLVTMVEDTKGQESEQQHGNIHTTGIFVAKNQAFTTFLS